MIEWSDFVAPSIAIGVATLAYRWQKGIDRRTAISIEMRKEYANFWNQSQAALKSANDGSLEYGDEAVDRLVASLSYIDIYGESHIYQICKELFDHIMYFSALSQSGATFPHHRDLVNAQKIDFLKKWMFLNDKLKNALKESHRNHLAVFTNGYSLRRLLGV